MILLGQNTNPAFNNNHYWDLGAPQNAPANTGISKWDSIATYVANSPGPRATEIASMVANVGLPVRFVLWAQGENDASAMYPSFQNTSFEYLSNNVYRYSNTVRYETATKNWFNYLRNNICNNSQLPIYIQSIARAYYHYPNSVIFEEIAGNEYYHTRLVQLNISDTQPNTFIGSWVGRGTESENSNGYIVDSAINVGSQKIHYTSHVYHGIAEDISNTYLYNINRDSERPTWTTWAPPGNWDVQWGNGYDVLISWSSSNGDNYILKNISVVSGDTLEVANIVANSNTTSWTWTAIHQNEYNGYLGGYFHITVAETDGNLIGSGNTLIYNIGNLAVSNSTSSANGFQSIKNSNNDIIVTWNSLNGEQFKLYNLNITNNAIISNSLFTATGNTVSFTFTANDQIDEYGGLTNYIYVCVARSFIGYFGPNTAWTAEVINPANNILAPNGFSASKIGNNIIMSWSANASSNDDFIVYNMSIIDFSIISVTNVHSTTPTASFTFTANEQMAEYGTLTNYIAAYVARTANGFIEPNTYFVDDTSI